MRHELPRIGYVVKCYPRFSETFIVNELLAIERLGADVEIFSLRPAADSHFHAAIAEVRAPVHYLPSDSPKGEALWRGLRAAAAELPELWPAVIEASDDCARELHQGALLALEVRRRGIGRLHAHFATTAASVARRAARAAGVPYSVTAHAKDIFHESVDRQALARKLAAASDIVTVSDFNKEHLSQLCPAAASRIHRIYNGLDLSRFEFTSPVARAPRIVAVGRLVEKKGFGDLVAACAVLRDRGVGFECRIIGSGPLDGALADAIEAAGLGSQVRLLGPRSQDQVRAELAHAAAFAAPCVVGADGNRDGLPTVLVEAMAMGAPCVSTDVTGIPEIVRHQRTGLMTAQHDPRGLAQALERLIAAPQLREEIATRARAMIEQRFDIDRNARALATLLGGEGVNHGAESGLDLDRAPAPVGALTEAA